MAETRNMHTLQDLSNNQMDIFLETCANTELRIYLSKDGRTVIKFPFGNKFDLIGGDIIIRPIKQ